MLKIQSTVLPNNQPGLTEWLKEFKAGIMAPKPREGRDRALKMMEEYNFTNISKRLKPCTEQ